ncbi:MAG: C39 family peptidase [Candidatus Cohnella colombiensis]|uniref:C39 family peptidase n=1 Tax=Candidatus Cohnella colombiensis TaxID=3121368 RepID=A0AA95EZW7_9BACL|nr:MAG: C39 family peptidase [Cohnella sp.]
MGAIIKVVLLFLLTVGSYSSLSSDTDNPMSLLFSKPKGSITITNVDEQTQEPIPGSQYVITEANTSEVLQIVTTGDDGIAKSGLFEYGPDYVVTQRSVMAPYQINEQPYAVEIKKEETVVTTNNSFPDYIKQAARTEERSVAIESVFMDVAVLKQLPELPNGCEITALTGVLNYYGYDVSKLVMADEYLAQEPFKLLDGKRYGADPDLAFAGNPRDNSGFFAYAGPIVAAANKYLQWIDGHHIATDLTGSSREEIIAHLNQGNPVVIWVTLDLSPPNINYAWYFHDSGQYFEAPVNLHAVVLNGYSGDQVDVMNPLEGQVSYSADAFFSSYQALGSHAMIVTGE